MAQGKKYNDDVREKAFALLALNNNCAYVAQALDLPYTTVKTWERKWLREAEEKKKTPHPSSMGQCNANEVRNAKLEGHFKTTESQGSMTEMPRTPSPQWEGFGEVASAPNAYEETSVDGLNLVELRQKKKEQFVDDAWRMLGKAQSLLERRLTRALEQEDALDALMAEFEKIGDEGEGGSLSDKELRAMYARFSALKLEDTRALSSVLGTLYDKQALASKEATQIVGGVVEVKKFEEM